ncbi:metallopeptidase TldD-related protein [Salinispora pacifica]|uniref:metallopeptidase TldD-related protein n=1 Tax=Salinispora pacifica TaxID=351187 RepID=UPI0003619924|nr:metallopeptidase TldD-related protein [Salinispora pacifica]
MTPTIWFSEHSLRLRVDVRPDGSFPTQRSTARGMSVERHLGDGCTEHRFTDGDALLGTGYAGPAGPAADALREVQGRPVFEVTAQHRALLTAIAAETGAELVLGVAEQHVAAGDPEQVRSTHRFVATLLLTLTGDDGTRHTQSVRWDPTDDPGTLALAARQTATQMRGRLGLPLAEELPVNTDLVLLPGFAGAFFHELVGHPMEADVVASGTSYLGQQLGHRVAPPWLSILDGGHLAGGGYRSAFDDEGADSVTSRLIDRGVVGRPMNDLALAQRLNTTRTGHGRRQNYRHPAIPRMTHTAAILEPGVEVEEPAGDWIAPRGLRLEMMNIASGAFVFHAPISVLHRADGTTARLGPLRIVGDGARALARIRPYAHQVAGYLRATGGCGKLGQYPVLVSFANAGLRLPAGSVGIRAVRHA